MTPDIILLEAADPADLPAGEFSDWLGDMVRAIRGEQESVVACGECNACCRSSYFIEVKPTDLSARQRIPAALLFDAPGAPAGFQLLGYDESGRCPMLEPAGCRIYADRPLTCRTYDCRIFAATGIGEAAASRSDVTARAMRWQFSYRDQESAERHRSLLLGARLLVDLQAQEVELPRTATQLAMLAVQLHEQFHRLAALLERQQDAAATREVRLQVLAAVREILPPR